MTKAEHKVGWMLVNYCDALGHSKTKTLAVAARKWGDSIRQRLDGPVGGAEKKSSRDF